jgi:hypothetical protein
MSRVSKVLLCLCFGVVLISFLFPNKIEKQEEVKNQVEKIKEKKQTRKIVTILEKPDGTKKTVIREDTNTVADTDIQSSTHSKKSVEIRSKKPTQISILTGFATVERELVYGLAVTKPVLGPVTIGVWGLNNKTIGASVGIEL